MAWQTQDDCKELYQSKKEDSELTKVRQDMTMQAFFYQSQSGRGVQRHRALPPVASMTVRKERACGDVDSNNFASTHVSATSIFYFSSNIVRIR